MLSHFSSTEPWMGPRSLHLQDVSASRGGVGILFGITHGFEPGTRWTVIGPSGAGKTTLLRLLNRLAEPSAGQISLGDTPITTLSVTRLRRTVGLVFQTPRPLPGTVRANLGYPCEIVNLPPPEDFSGRLEEVGLDPSWLDRDAAGLSGGERQRLAIAVALVNKPLILALDEPTSALDPTAARKVADALRERSRRDGLTTISVTHNRDQTPWLSDFTLVLEAGRVIDQGPTAEVLQRVDPARFWPKSEGAIA